MLQINDKKNIVKRVLIDFLIFALLLASDLISKDIVINRLDLKTYTSYVLVDGIFAIYPCFNDGASFSFLSGKTGFLIALTAILMIVLAVFVVINSIKRPKTSWLFRWSMMLLIAGGMGNLVDRVFCDGLVRDFIQYLFLDGIFEKLFNTGFGVGNVADIYLVLGIFLLCAYIVFDYKEGDLGIFKIKKQEAVADNADVSSEQSSSEASQNNSQEIPTENDGEVKQ